MTPEQRDAMLRAIVKPLEWKALGADLWEIDCPASGLWVAHTENERTSFDTNRRASISAALNLDPFERLVDAAFRARMILLRFAVDGQHSGDVVATLDAALTALTGGQNAG